MTVPLPDMNGYIHLTIMLPELVLNVNQPNGMTLPKE